MSAAREEISFRSADAECAGHFDLYLGEAFERLVGDQVDFLERSLP